jgi:hypothetical protein
MRNIVILGALFFVVAVVLIGASVFTQRSPVDKEAVNNEYHQNNEQYCIKTGTDNQLSLSQAKEIGASSECGENYADSYICNEITGTWWIDLNINKLGCSPACVVDVVSGKAEINWRCTGARPY